MKVLKNDLYAFVDGKVSKERIAVSKQQDALKEDIRKIVENAVQEKWGSIGDRLNRAHDDFEVFLKNIHKAPDYSFRNRLSDIIYVINSRTKAASEITNDVMKHVRGGSLALGYDLLFSETDLKVIDLIKTKYEPLQKKMDDLDTLKIELDAVIKASSSGKRAYNAMVALGVNMDGLVSAESQLPAVQKLSVDVCAINGGC